MRLLVTVILVVAASAAPARSDDTTARAYREALGYAQRGMSALGKGNASKAMQDFRRAMDRVPALPEAHLGLGHIAMGEKRFEDALREYRMAEDGHDELASLRMMLENERYARSRDELQELRDERAQLERLRTQSLSRVTGNATRMQDTGPIEREIIEIDRRIHALEAMNAPTPQPGDATPAVFRFHEGAALFDLARTDEAIAAWESAAKSDPKFGPVYNNLAVAYWKQGRLEDARAALARADALGFKVNPSFRSDLDLAFTSRASSRP